VEAWLNLSCRRSVRRFAEKGSKRFFLKKEAKTFIHWALPVDPDSDKWIKVFWFFFSKKNRFLPPPYIAPAGGSAF
jgi:hypothetical protein